MHIQELEIFTAKLEEQTRFYSQVLALDMVERSGTSVSFRIGASTLKLSYRKASVPYHYAINIPANQEQEALQWLKERVEILLYGDIEIQYFKAWNAYAVYFYDADKNIVELIARKHLKNNSNQPFGKNSMLEISEIGLPTTDIRQEYEILKATAGVPVFSGNLESFCAIGDGHGLFIVINKKIKQYWFPTEDKPLSADFKIRFIEKGKAYNYKYENEVFKQALKGLT